MKEREKEKMRRVIKSTVINAHAGRRSYNEDEREEMKGSHRTYKRWGGALSVAVIVVGNEIGDSNSNTQRSY